MAVTPDIEALEDLITDAIDDSMDMDWTSRIGAKAVLRWLADEGLQIVPIPKRETDCPASHDGRHHVDTSMESGPNNCFHCEVSMS